MSAGLAREGRPSRFLVGAGDALPAPASPAGLPWGRMPSFKDHWLERTATTEAGVLTWVEFPDGPAPFIGCTKLDGVNIAPVDAHGHLTAAGHPAGELDYIGSGCGVD